MKAREREKEGERGEEVGEIGGRRDHEKGRR